MISISHPPRRNPGSAPGNVIKNFVNAKRHIRGCYVTYPGNL